MRFFSKRTAVGGSVAAGAVGILMTLIPMLEGHTNTAVIPVAGDVPTICFGHQKGVKAGDTATDEECIQFLKAELDDALKDVDRLVKIDISDEERAAYGSLVYNVGAGNFSKSTMLRKVNDGDRLGACRQFPRWVYFQGRKLKGLENRRAVEMALCLSGVRQ